MCNIQLLHGDCLRLMKDIPNESIDMILADLPYGTSACKWDQILDFSEMWKDYERIIKPAGVIVLFGNEPFSSKLRLSNEKLYKYDWKWEKPAGANFLNFKYQPAKVHEDIIIFGKSASSYSKKGNMYYFPIMEKGEAYQLYSGKQREDSSTVRSSIDRVITKNDGTRYPRSVLKFNKDKDKYHPTQKPVSLCEYLIKTYTNENMTVLDNTMGSGTTGVACVRTNRHFIGIEQEENYFNIAQERINNEIQHQKMQTASLF